MHDVGKLNASGSDLFTKPMIADYSATSAWQAALGHAFMSTASLTPVET